jgi:hypothetical protein
MIKVDHSPLFVWFFNLFSRFMLRKHFREVTFGSTAEPGSGPVLLIGNHFSWWDGFIACYINQKIFRRKFHVMMLEEQLKGRLFLSRAGAFSIRKGHRSALESLQYASSLLQHDANLVTLYPQGAFQSLSAARISFEPGIIRILEHARDARVFFYVALVDYFRHKKPSMTIYLKEATGASLESLASMEGSFNRHYDECRARQIADQ